MNATPTEIEPAPTTPAPAEPLQDRAIVGQSADAAYRALARELSRSLQLSRGSTLALTRLQLALNSGDRRAAMGAMDRLHALDAELERIAARLPSPADGEPDSAEWNAIARHLGDQKAALAFEKLRLVSEISGPDLVSVGQPLAASDVFPSTAPVVDESVEEPSPPAEPVASYEPAAEDAPRQSWDPATQRALGLLFAAVVFGALIWAAWLMTTG